VAQVVKITLFLKITLVFDTEPCICAKQKLMNSLSLLVWQCQSASFELFDLLTDTRPFQKVFTEDQYFVIVFILVTE